MCLLLQLPIDVVFEIAIYVGRYDEYLILATIYPGLNTEHRKLQARDRLITYTPKVFIYSQFESIYMAQRKHNLGEPAHIYRVDGKAHRDRDLPAVICGTQQEWYSHGVRHRDGDKPAFIDTNVHAPIEEYWVDGKLHRDGVNPAIINNNTKWWFHHGVNIKYKSSMECMQQE